MPKNLIYFGSPDFSAEILESVIKSGTVNVVGVVTTPDKPQGRKQILTPSSVSRMASKYDLPAYKPAKLDEANLAHLKLLKPDILLAVSYGKIIPKTWLETPAIGTFNVHFSLLPKYRGALCIQEAIKNQDTETGVTFMVMDELMDHGPLISQQKVTIDINDDVASLTTKLTQTAIDVLDHNLPEICAQNYTSIPQDESLAIFTPSHRSLTRDSAYISWEKIQNAIDGNDAETIHALIRSLNPEPGAWTTVDGMDIKILKTGLEENKLKITTIQKPGKNPISWQQFLSGLNS